jgi:fatty acid desaturase
LLYCLFLKLILYFKLLFYNFYIEYNYSFYLTVIITVIPTIIFYTLFILFTQINHIHTTNFVNNKNFYKHQIITAHNVSPQSFLIRLYSGGLNLQIEHHLFPSVNSCHLPALSKIIKPLCLKHNIKYNEFPSLYQAIKDTIKTIKKLTFKTISNFNFKIV